MLCVDEKSQMQALQRSQPALPMMPGMPERRTHDYVRHGTTTLFAALNVADGTVITSLHRRHRATEFKKFLTKVEAQVPEDLQIHLICDNYGTHKHPIIKTWLGAHPRVHLHFTPTYSIAGSTWSNGSSATSPPTCSNAATTAASKHSKQTSAHGSRPGTPTPKPSSGPRPPTRSSPSSDDLYDELQIRVTRRDPTV